MPKLLDREPTQEMLKAIASSDCAPSNYKRMFQSAYDAAQEVKQEPFGYVREIRPREWKFSKTTSWGPDIWAPVYRFPPDAQAEIERRDARISRLENELADALDLKAGNGPTALAMQAARIMELEEREQILVRANSSANILNNELAAQNQQLREALNEAGRLYCTMIGNDLMHNPSMFARNTVCTYVRSWFRKCKPKVIESALSFHDLASPVLNRVKAEALRDAADEFDAQGEWKGHGQQLRQIADAIEKGEALAAIKEEIL